MALASAAPAFAGPQYVDDKLYLNLQPSVTTLWEEDIPGNIVAAEGRWPELDPKPASTRSVPDLPAGQAPVAN
ncbi:MAG: hypothetical protein EA405_07440 [Rhodospirillales bacterium]|nr:MAG: hypothetical protein EA405_07440 [Rhodospirillales bacterium]